MSYVSFAGLLAFEVACWLRWIIGMRPQPSLRFRFFTESHTAAESSANQVADHDDAPPPPSRRNRLTARQEWLQAELAQAAALARKVDAA